MSGTRPVTPAPAPDASDALVNATDRQHLACPSSGDPAPVFAEPWEAHAFAMTLDLHARGLFTWGEWTEALARELAAAANDSYYRCWLAALETLVVAKGLASADDLARCALAWDRAADRTPHGRPIELQPRDFV